MRNLYINLILVAIGLFLLSCEKKSSIDTGKANEKVFKVEQIEIEKESVGCENQSSGSCAKIKIKYPLLKDGQNENANKKINGYLRIQLLQPIFDEDEYSSIDSLISAYFNEYEATKGEIPVNQQPWEIERIITVENQNDKFLSVEYSEFTYLGGAHPNTFITYSNFYLNNGDLISLDECFNEGYETELNNIAEKIFREQNKIPAGTDLNAAGFWFDDNKFEVSDHFAILNKGLLFYYNAYEIAPYAFGPTELIVPYNEIKKIISADGPIGSYVIN